MRTTRLATIALQAEKVRLERTMRQYAIRAAVGVVGVVFAVLALAFAHVAGYDALCLRFAPHWSALIVLGVDLVLALILFLIAARGTPDPVAVEAVQVRNDAWAQIKDTVALTALVAPLGRALGRKHVYGLTLAALTARFLSRPQ